ncbi:MAG: anti-sigma factor [Fimbriimonadales bacterium]|nr:anti-sigma factor [Fimbriimonadales bacterium]
MRRGECDWTRRRRWRYLDKTLPASLQRRVEAHLAVCIPCRAEFTLAQDALNALTAGNPLTPEQQRALQRPKARLSLSRIATIAILALLMGASFYWYRTQGNILLARLSQRGIQADAQVMDATPAPFKAGSDEPLVKLQESDATTSPALEPRNISATPQPAVASTPPKPPRTVAPRRTLVRPKRRVARPRTPARPPRSPMPAKGTVEVYDEAGSLIKREKMEEKP